ncbi:hypothetical protein ANCCAN_01920 [Ancylostoma caninum]|uniref:Uncharacterized protein n=1 Tax=Ancylostoma caninum TaxID=29170 RepID=A0A368H5F9_ANCCA|nr:hypothetical protein ANCCAN_01920 [Ancylostoma caninum]
MMYKEQRNKIYQVRFQETSDGTHALFPLMISSTIVCGTDSDKSKPKAFNCLFVGDVFNYGTDQDAYEMEADLIADVAHDLFTAFRSSSIGLWAYGHTKFAKSADSALKRMRKKYSDFIIELKLMKYFEIDDPLSTKAAIEQLNRLPSSKDVVDCLVFFSAQQDVQSLPMLYPVNLGADTVVAVGLNDTDLYDRVHPSFGIAISVPIKYADSDVKSIVDAITKRTKPTRKPKTTTSTTVRSSTVPPVTTKEPVTTKTPTTTALHPVTTEKPSTTKESTTTALPSWRPDCLFIGDLYNYGDDEDAYDQEGELIDAVAYELFDSTSVSSLGLWAFGYTNFPKQPSISLEKMRKNYNDFQRDLANFSYVNISDPMETKSAIEAINAIRDNGARINCIVFFSSTKSTQGLPRIAPEPIGVEKVVGVGVNNANLDAILPANGIGVRIPKFFMDNHVSEVVNAIVSRPQPITTRITTTEPSYKRRDCIFVGDLYNFGNNTESYDQEMRFISDVAYDLLDPWWYKTSAGFWAYGYTNFSKFANSSLEHMTKDYNKFHHELVKMEYVKIADPMTTKE